MPPFRARIALTLIALALLAPVAAAHAGGGAGVEARWEMPPWVVWITGAGVVALSFAVVGAFLTRPLHAGGYDALPLGAESARRSPLAPGRVAGALALLAVLVTGFLPAPFETVPGALVWLVTWSALPLVAYTVGNAWEVVNPFRVLGALADRVRGDRTPRAYPSRLGAWPSVVLFLALVAFEVAQRDPRALSAAVGAYALATFAGMVAFGSDAWLARAEVFTRTFRWWSAAAPFRVTREGVRWRGFARGLSHLRVDGVDDVAFTVAVLYGVNYDGFLQTPWGAAALDALAPAGSAVAHAVVLVAGYGAFLAAFVLCARGIRAFAESLAPTRVLAARFAASLVPIAVGYHAAHNLFYVIEAAPALVAGLDGPVIPAAAAPVVGVLQMALIVTGHVIAVIAAHHLAFAGFPSRVQAIRSELPLTAVMVFYTFVGLWIVSKGAHAAVGGGGF